MTAKPPKALRLYNGRGQERRDASGRWETTGHVYIAAYSHADAVRVMREAGFNSFTRHELMTYFSKGCWGNRMLSVTPVRGVWAVQPGEDFSHTAQPRQLTGPGTTKPELA